MKNTRKPKRNCSAPTTVGIDRGHISVRDSLLPLRPLLTSLVLCIVGIVLLSLVACAPISPMKLSSDESLSLVSRTSLNGPPETPSKQNLPVYTYQAQQLSVPIVIPVEPLVSGTVKLSQSRLVILSGVIDESILVKANELVAFGESSKKAIDIVINSPGGSVSHGLAFIQAMRDIKAKGIVIRCFVPTLAASMAFNIFTQCSERYVLPYSQLLFHSPRIGGTFMITAQGARQLAVGMASLEAILVPMIAEAMGIDSTSSEWFMTSYNEERMFMATELFSENPYKWFTVVGSITGYPGTLSSPYERQETPSAVTPQNPNHLKAGDL